MFRSVVFLLLSAALIVSGCDSLRVPHAFDMGVTYYEQEKYALALQRFDIALRCTRLTDSQMTLAHLMKSVCLLNLGHPQEALREAHEARRFVPPESNDSRLADDLIARIERCINKAGAGQD